MIYGRERGRKKAGGGVCFKGGGSWSWCLEVRRSPSGGDGPSAAPEPWGNEKELVQKELATTSWGRRSAGAGGQGWLRDGSKDADGDAGAGKGLPGHPCSAGRRRSA